MLFEPSALLTQHIGVVMQPDNTLLSVQAVHKVQQG